MVVGVLRLQLLLPGTASLKEKRAVLRRLLERVRSRFHVAAAEVSEQDKHQSAVVGFTTVGADGRKVASVLERVARFVDGLGLADVAEVEQEVVRYDELGELPASYAEKYGVPEAGPIHEGRGGAGDADRRLRFRPGSLGLGSRKAREDEP